MQAIGGGVVLGAIILAQLSSAPKKKDAEAVAPASP